MTFYVAMINVIQEYKRQNISTYLDGNCIRKCIIHETVFEILL
jgi:hypothetical protein